MREDGTSEAMFHRLPAWHGKGTIVQDAPNSTEAIRLAQMNWSVEKRPIFTLDGDGNRIHITSDMATVRTDSNGILGVVGNKYTVIQNADAFKFVDSLVDLGEIKYEACGTLKGGQQIWLLAKMPDVHYVTDDDPQESYILLSTGHDGLHTLKVMPTSVRVVCWNTLQLALSHKTERFIQVRHSLNAMDKVEAAQKLLFGIRYETEQVNQILDGLAKVDMTREQVMEFMDKVFPLHKEKPEDDGSTKSINIRQMVFDNFDGDPEQATKAAKGTAFGLFNAVTKWVDWQRGAKDTDKQFASSWFGSGSVIKQNALVTLRKQFGI
jgi:phage/plasmid-like protein (TIGR03299 family)